jgi:hypothetical protein
MTLDLAGFDILWLLYPIFTGRFVANEIPQKIPP